ncbi:transporter substrate-binding domain-containing protein [Alkalimonas sp. MEB108]|uniref:Transporter substrate-binding domain-containing protein n=1 Tax=Alkalimonas cellulosilytica TaxID=3058395 RepID=A0ABU7J9H1_9GAMM|nr:transporter substrate-binding domain-containing protein [Alkalimonas sp. MEB108]MEE2002865.1 transporter substrate-binding domain-containing protein [Alkalimonas sp. MEB108]
MLQKLTLPCLLIMLSLFLAACSPEPVVSLSPLGQDRGDSFQQAQQQGQASLTVLYVPAEGFAYTNAAGELTGVSVEIMRDFARWAERHHRIRLQLNFVEETNWQHFYQRVMQAEGGVFGLGNVTITEARKQELQFSPPYMNNVAALITHQDVAELQDWADFPSQFAELEPLAFSGTLHEVRIRRLRDSYQPGLAIQRVTSNPDLLELVASGAFYSYVDAYNYWRARQAGMPLRDHPLAAETDETFGFIMPLNSDWSQFMQAFFAAEGGYRHTASYRQIMQQHLGQELAELLLGHE